jgi:hypothetical protein
MNNAGIAGIRTVKRQQRALDRVRDWTFAAGIRLVEPSDLPERGWMLGTTPTQPWKKACPEQAALGSFVIHQTGC